MKNISFLLTLFLLLGTNINAQRLKIKGDNMRGANDQCKGCILFTGNVNFTRNGALIKCERALYHKNTNTVDASENVRIYRKDSDYPLRGDKLFFDGNTNIAHLRDNVYYEDDDISFTTEKFDYNTNTEEGFYFDGGIVKDSLNTLISEQGFVFGNNDIIVKDSVEITTPDYLVLADSIKYNSDLETVYIIAPATLYSDSSTLYAQGGYYNTRTSFAFLTNKSHMVQGPYYIEGDTLSYNENTMMGEAFGNVLLDDSSQTIMLKGNYVSHNGAEDYSYMSDSAQMLFYGGFDTLYAHAETFIYTKDTSENALIIGDKNVRFFRLDVQGKCDSMVYSMSDSIATLYHNPIMWSLFNQMSGETIDIHMTNNRVSHMVMTDDAFIAAREDSLRFNQVSGRKITGFIRGNELHKIDVEGQAESIYYSREGMDLVGFNKSESNYLTIYMKDSQIEKLSMKPAALGHFHSMESLPYEEQFLRNFHWRSDLRPISPIDIFRKTAPEEDKSKRKRRR